MLMFASSTSLGESGGLSQPLPGARSNFHPPVRSALPAQTQLLDQGPVALEVVPLQVIEHPAAAADELQQTAPRVMVLRVRTQVLRELVDAGREEGDLHLRRPRVGGAPAVLADDLELGFLRVGHVTSN